MTPSPAEPDRFTYAGLFLTTLSLLQLEIFLTRIFSVTMWYHFAFMAISLAMFGIAAGAVLVELMPEGKPHRALSGAGLMFAVSSAACFTLQLRLPINPGQEIAPTTLAFTITAVPFIFAGVVICVALTRFPARTRSLYAADLAGSAAGCLLAIPILNHVHAPTAVILNAAIAALGAAAFARRASPARAALAMAACSALVLAAAVNSSARIVDIRWVKGGAPSARGVYEKWNALSRIQIDAFRGAPFGWGLSPTYQSSRPVDQLYLGIDAGAGTVITRFDGRLDGLEYLKYDVTALAHHLRPRTSVLVIGVGGGRDLLTALVFGQERVVGVEINGDILDVLTGRFADFSGHLDRRPGVTLVHDEARSYIARSAERFGIIQASLIDTWAATSAGAYVLTENGLYTKEAWRIFLDHLTPDGILTMSRWHHEAQPAETLRLAALATSSLVELGIEDPRPHIMIVRTSSGIAPSGVATILVSRRPFSSADTARIVEVSRAMAFRPLLTPDRAETAEFEAIATRGRYEEFVRRYPLNVAAPTDDTPFFFHMLRATDLLKASTYQGMNEINLKAVRVLGTSLAIVIVLSAAAIVVPLAVRPRVRERRSASLLIYFAAIGLAFMMVEIGQLERLIVFLGHPVYGLTVVLFVLLIASSLGSLVSHRAGRWIWALPATLAAFIWLSPMITRELGAASTPARVMISAAMLVPSSFFMGMAFPLGMREAGRRDGAPTAWYWGVNGAFSVIASVLAVVVAVFLGVTVTLLVGLAAYVVALAALWRSTRRATEPPIGADPRA